MVNEYNADSMSNQPRQNAKVFVSQTISASVVRHRYGKNHSCSMHAHIKWALKPHCPCSRVDQPGSRQS